MPKSRNNQREGHKIEYFRTLAEELEQENMKDIVREYAKLAISISLSDEQVIRMAQILDLSQDDNILEFWLSEVDHFLDHELGLWDLDADKDQLSILKEFLSVPNYERLIPEQSKISEKDINFYQELQSRIESICSNDVCDSSNATSVTILITLPEPDSSGKKLTSRHLGNFETEILMDIALSCCDEATLRLESTEKEDAITLRALVESLPQPYGDIINSNKFIPTKWSQSKRNISFHSTQKSDAVSFKELMTKYVCPIDNKPLIEHKFKVVKSFKPFELSSSSY